jgi:hypothetical protein
MLTHGRLECAERTVGVALARANEAAAPCTGSSFPGVIEFSSSFIEYADEICGGIEFAHSHERLDRIHQKIVVDREVPEVDCGGRLWRPEIRDGRRRISDG